MQEINKCEYACITDDTYHASDGLADSSHSLSRFRHRLLHELRGILRGKLSFVTLSFDDLTNFSREDSVAAEFHPESLGVFEDNSVASQVMCLKT